LATKESERKNRIIAFIVITLVFVVSVAALLYWAVNVATARLSERTIKQVQALSPRTTITEERAMVGSVLLPRLSGAIKF
jgi:flagellar basal body-associated protein FliL